MLLIKNHKNTNPIILTKSILNKTGKRARNVQLLIISHSSCELINFRKTLIFCLQIHPFYRQNWPKCIIIQVFNRGIHGTRTVYSNHLRTFEVCSPAPGRRKRSPRYGSAGVCNRTAPTSSNGNTDFNILLKKYTSHNNFFPSETRGIYFSSKSQ